MNDTVSVGRLESLRHLRADSYRRPQRKPTVLHRLPESLPFHELRSEKDKITYLFKTVKGNNIGMVQRRDGTRLLLKTFQPRRIGRELPGQELQRHFAV